MKGYRFYQEYADKARTLPTGQALAVVTDEPQDYAVHYAHKGTVPAVTGVFNGANSPVTYGEIGREYLRRCRRIPETEARGIHPALFSYLEDSGNDGRDSIYTTVLYDGDPGDRPPSFAVRRDAEPAELVPILKRATRFYTGRKIPDARMHITTHEGAVWTRHYVTHVETDELLATFLS